MLILGQAGRNQLILIIVMIVIIFLFHSVNEWNGIVERRF